jgi:hypothetical protein
VKLCFLASPNDQAESIPVTNVKSIKEWREFARQTLLEAEIGCYDALAGFSYPEGEERDWRVEAVHLEVLWHADCMLALLPKGVTTWGVPIEIVMGVTFACGRIAVVGAIPSWVLEGLDRRPPQSTKIKQFKTIKKAVEWLADEEERETGVVSSQSEGERDE